MENLVLRWWTSFIFRIKQTKYKDCQDESKTGKRLETQDGGMQGGRVQQVYGDVQYAVRQHQLCCSSMQLLTVNGGTLNFSALYIKLFFGGPGC